MNSGHAYSAYVGRNVGIKIDGVGIVAGTIMSPDAGQDDNIVNVQTHDGVWHQVRYMDTYRFDFVNASLPVEAYECGFCGGVAHFDEDKRAYVHTFTSDRVPSGNPGDYVSAAHNRAGTIINPADLVEVE